MRHVQNLISHYLHFVIIKPGRLLVTHYLFNLVRFVIAFIGHGKKIIMSTEFYSIPCNEWKSNNVEKIKCDIIKGNESLVENFNFNFFLHHFLITSKCPILTQTPLQLNIWLQSYEGFDNARNN